MTRTKVSALSERRQAATQLDIAEAAESLFVERGYEATTVEQIANKAGVSLRTFYRYCTGKDDVLTTVLAESIHALVALVATQPPSLSVFDAVSRSLTQQLQNDVGAAGRQRLARVMLTTPVLRVKWLGATREAQDALAPLLAERRGWEPDSLRSVTLAGLVLSAVTTALEFSVLRGLSLDECLDASLGVLNDPDRPAA